MDHVFVVDTGEEAGREPGISRGAAPDLEALLSRMQEGSLRLDLGRFYPDGTCYVLGLREQADGVLAAWEGMSAGDLVLGYRKGAIVSASNVLAKVRDPLLAETLWDGDTHGPFGLLCFTDKPRTGEVPIVPQMYRYLDQEYGEFTKLDAGRVRNILSDYGSLEAFVSLCLTYDFPFSFRHSQD